MYIHGSYVTLVSNPDPPPRRKGGSGYETNVRFTADCNMFVANMCSGASVPPVSVHCISTAVMLR